MLWLVDVASFLLYYTFFSSIFPIDKEWILLKLLHGNQVAAALIMLCTFQLKELNSFSHREHTHSFNQPAEKRLRSLAANSHSACIWDDFRSIDLPLVYTHTTMRWIWGMKSQCGLDCEKKQTARISVNNWEFPAIAQIWPSQRPNTQSKENWDNCLVALIKLSRLHRCVRCWLIHKNNPWNNKTSAVDSNSIESGDHWHFAI